MFLRKVFFRGQHTIFAEYKNGQQKTGGYVRLGRGATTCRLLTVWVGSFLGNYKVRRWLVAPPLHMQVMEKVENFMNFLDKLQKYFGKLYAVKEVCQAMDA